MNKYCNLLLFVLIIFLNYKVNAQVVPWNKEPCFKSIIVPAYYDTIYKTVQISDAYEVLDSIIPPIYETVTEQILIKPTHNSETTFDILQEIILIKEEVEKIKLLMINEFEYEDFEVITQLLH